MKTVGLITEYNPFHNGHLYHIRKAKELSGADYCVVVMSGSFVQRGEPAIYDKYTRTKMALIAGADLVLEIPCLFSTASAKEFAAYSVALLDNLGVVDFLCFGSECGDLSLLNSLASILSKEPEEYSASLKSHLKLGCSFPEARGAALDCYLMSRHKEKASLAVTALKHPNNILGIEYCIALGNRKSNMRPLTIKREDNGYHSISMEGDFGSALAIRTALLSQNPITSLSHLVPEHVLSFMKNSVPVFLDDFSLLLNYKITRACAQGEALNQYLDLNEALAFRLKKKQLELDTFDNRIKQLKGKQITYTRASRALLHFLLDIKTADFTSQKEEGYAKYGRVLGFRRHSSPLLAQIKKHSEIPIVTKLANARQLIDQTSLKTLELEIQASHIYQTVKKEKGGNFQNEYTMPITII